MKDPDFLRRVNENLAEEAGEPLCWWWCSFAENGLLGVAIVQARGITSAAQEAHRRGINPGGQLLAYPLGEDADPGEYANRLLSRAEADLASRKLVGVGTRRVGDLEDDGFAAVALSPAEIEALECFADGTVARLGAHAQIIMRDVLQGIVDRARRRAT